MGEAEVIPLEGRARRREDAPRKRSVAKCRAITSEGSPCKNDAVGGSGYCSVHAESEAMAEHPSSHPSKKADDRLGLEEFLRRRMAGEYPIDEFGYDEHLSREVLMPLIRPLYENYFRVRTLGMSRVPDEGSALLVGNHSGTVPLDSVMLQYAVAAEHPSKRLLRSVGADLVWRLPVIGPLGRKTGNVVACDEDAYELLRRGELVGIFPEGFKGVGKGWKERYKLQRFGRGGFIELALRTRTPIIPVAIVGAEEAYPMIGNLKMIARTFGFPYFPITPTFPLLGPLGLLPLPSRWIIEFGEPIPMDDYPEDAADDAMLVFDLTDRVRDTIQQMVYGLLKERGGVFL